MANRYVTKKDFDRFLRIDPQSGRPSKLFIEHIEEMITDEASLHSLLIEDKEDGHGTLQFESI